MERPIVVVVEDHSALRALVTHIVRKGLGAEVVGAVDGEHALRLVPSIRPNLLLLDMDLPRVHGLEVARRLRADPVYAEMPILAMSADSVAHDALAAGCDAFIDKPFRAHALVSAIRDLLRDDLGAVHEGSLALA